MERGAVVSHCPVSNCSEAHVSERAVKATPPCTPAPKAHGRCEGHPPLHARSEGTRQAIFRRRALCHICVVHATYRKRIGYYPSRPRGFPVRYRHRRVPAVPVALIAEVWLHCDSMSCVLVVGCMSSVSAWWGGGLIGLLLMQFSKEERLEKLRCAAERSQIASW